MPHQAPVRMGTVSAPFRSFVLVSRGQIARNYRNVCSVVGPGVDVLGVVKADAYGHGAIEVARILVAEGARWLAVSSVDEGATLRAAGGDHAAHPGDGRVPAVRRAALVEHDLTPAAHSLEQMRDLGRLAAAAGKPVRYHLKIDSGDGPPWHARLGGRRFWRLLRQRRTPTGRPDDALRLGGRLHQRADRRTAGLLRADRATNCGRPARPC